MVKSWGIRGTSNVSVFVFWFSRKAKNKIMTDKDGLDQHPEGFPIPVGGSEYYDEPLGKMVKSNVQNDLL